MIDVMILLQLEFLRPNRLLALVVIPLLAVLYLLLAQRSSKPTMSNRLRRVIPRDAAWKRHGAVILALLSLASLIVAWAMPKDYAYQPRDRASVVVVIDVSWSMMATDVEPSRLDAAKESAKQFVDSMPPRFNVALVSFAGTANVAVPPTVDRDAMKRGIDALEMAPSTATGEAIYMSLEALKLVPPNPDDPDDVPPAAIVLLGDGATNMGRNSFTAAEDAGEVGVPVYTIAYGTASGYVEANGQRQRVAVDHYEMTEIARRSGGQKFSAESASELSAIYEAISSDIGRERVVVEVTDRYAGLAIIFAVGAALGVISLGARWP